jgi:urease accessory protein
VRARASATVHPDGVLGVLRCEPPLTLRRVQAEDAVTRLCLVGTAAGPLPGDDLELTLNVTDHAHAELIATGAAIAQGRDGVPARLSLRADVGADASLRADPGPLVVCAGARVDVAVALTLAPDAAVEWRELVVLGRTQDSTPGAARIRWDVVRAGRAVLRQHVDLADDALRSWTGMTGAHRVVGTVFICGPLVHARTVVASGTAIAQRLDDTTALLTVLGDSAAEVTRQLDDLALRLAHQPARA